jgi:hypothetical protein
LQSVSILSCHFFGTRSSTELDKEGGHRCEFP